MGTFVFNGSKVIVSSMFRTHSTHRIKSTNVGPEEIVAKLIRLSI